MTGLKKIDIFYLHAIKSEKDPLKDIKDFPVRKFLTSLDFPACVTFFNAFERGLPIKKMYSVTYLLFIIALFFPLLHFRSAGQHTDQISTVARSCLNL